MRDAQRLAGTRTKRETVELALAEFIAMRRRERLRGMLGKSHIALTLGDLEGMRADD